MLTIKLKGLFLTKLFLATTILVTTTITLAQTPQASIATWKNDAAGAYSFIHDDYGDNSVSGINNYADTIARNRGIKFTIGAITSACEANPQMWTDAIDMINYGHEIINHTHNHYCAVRRDDWCTTGLWAEPSTEDFATEMTHSSDLIKNNTGTTPRFFIYPYDLFNDAANNHLKSLNYIGSRTGTYDGDNTANFAPDNDGFFRTAFYVKTQDNNGDITAIDLNQWADHASANNVWVNREMHNVGATGWGRIGVAEYRDHLNHLKAEVDANRLWVGTISEVLTYQIQKINYTPSTSYNSQENKITVSWNTPTFDVANYLAPLSKKSPVTILVNLDGVDASEMTVHQGSKMISEVTVTNGIMKFDAYPSEGLIEIKEDKCTDFCLVKGLSSLIVNNGASASFNIEITATPAVSYQWYFNEVLVVGENTNSLTLNDVKMNQAGTYKVIASKAGKTDIVSTATLTVENQTPYNSNVQEVPGTIEFENFDTGGQGISYNENSNSNQGGANYRNEPVDIEATNGGGYNISYVQTGEWLEYTINVLSSGIYSVNVTSASLTTDGSVKLLVDNQEVTPSLSLLKSGGWQEWKNSKFSNIILSKGNHVLRVEMESDDMNLDKMVFTLDQATSSITAKKEEASIFPNPFSSTFSIQTKLSPAKKIKILSLDGKVLEQHFNLNDLPSISLGENLQSGIYLLEYYLNTNKYQEKIIKK